MQPLNFSSLSVVDSSALLFSCPRCEAGVEARQRILDQSPFENLWAAILPFILIGVASLLVERIGKGPS